MSPGLYHEVRGGRHRLLLRPRAQSVTMEGGWASLSETVTLGGYSAVLDGSFVYLDEPGHESQECGPRPALGVWKIPEPCEG